MEIIQIILAFIVLCLKDIATHTVILHKLYDFLPTVSSIKIFDSELVSPVYYENKKLNIQ